jgi:hypothetical protein
MGQISNMGQEKSDEQSRSLPKFQHRRGILDRVLDRSDVFEAISPRESSAKRAAFVHTIANDEARAKY